MQQIKFEPMIGFKYCKISLLKPENYRTNLDTFRSKF